MAWVTPPTFVSGNALTAAQLNILGDDLLETAAGKASAAGQFFVSTAANTLAARSLNSDVVATAQGTSSTSFTNLSTAGPTVTVTTGTSAVVFLTVRCSCSVAGGAGFASFDVSGATTVSASESKSTVTTSNGADEVYRVGITRTQTALTAGSNTFQMKYKVSSGSGTGTFTDREIMVLPIN